MKTWDYLLFGLLIFALAACSPESLEPTATLTPSSTPSPSASAKLTSTPTATFTPSITPTPSPTLIAGGGGVVTWCFLWDGSDSFWNGNRWTDNTAQFLSYFDLRSQEMINLVGPMKGHWDFDFYAFQPEIRQQFLATHGFSEEFIASLHGLQDIIVSEAMPFCLSTDRNEFVTMSGYVDLDAPEYVVYRPFGDAIFSLSYDDRVTNYPTNSHYFLSFSPSSDIYRITFPGGVVENITASFDPEILSFGVSPKGDYIGIKTDEGIWVSSTPNINFELIIEMPKKWSSYQGADGPQWSFDSQRITFMNGGDVYIAERNGDNLHTISQMLPIGFAASPQWTPDDRIILWSENQSAWSIIAVDPQNGEKQIFITVSPRDIHSHFDIPALWSPDNQWFLAEVSYHDPTGQSRNRIIPQNYVCNLEFGNCIRLESPGASKYNYCGFGYWAFGYPLEIENPIARTEELEKIKFIFDYFGGKVTDQGIVIDNRNNSEGIFRRPHDPTTMSGPFSITLNVSGDLGKTTIYIIGKPQDDDWWDAITLYIHPKNSSLQLQIRDGRSEDSRIFLPTIYGIRAGETFTLEFSDAQGQSFQVKNRLGEILAEYDVSEFEGIYLPQGLFPDRLLYIGYTLDAGSVLTIHEFSIEDDK